MRALLYSPKGTGHVNPTLPLAKGLVERGHEVTYTASQGAGVLLPIGELSAARLSAEVLRVNEAPFRDSAARLAKSLQAAGGLERALAVITQEA